MASVGDKLDVFSLLKIPLFKRSMANCFYKFPTACLMLQGRPRGITGYRYALSIGGCTGEGYRRYSALKHLIYLE
jgi:hypothetical protein